MREEEEVEEGVEEGAEEQQVDIPLDLLKTVKIDVQQLITHL